MGSHDRFQPVRRKQPFQVEGVTFHLLPTVGGTEAPGQAMGWRTAALESGRAQGSVRGKGASVGASTELTGPRPLGMPARGPTACWAGTVGQRMGVLPLGLAAHEKLQNHSACPISGTRD